MKAFQIAKNIEREPRVYGLLPRYLYLFLIILFGGMLIGGILLLALIGGKGGVSFLIFLVSWFFLIIGSYTYFRRLSNAGKYKFGNQRKIHSNKDLYKYL